jgi:hypothetical protein
VAAMAVLGGQPYDSLLQSNGSNFYEAKGREAKNWWKHQRILLDLIT